MKETSEYLNRPRSTCQKNVRQEGKCVIVEELTSTMHVEADVTYTTMNDVRQDKGDSVCK